MSRRGAFLSAVGVVLALLLAGLLADGAHGALRAPPPEPAPGLAERLRAHIATLAAAGGNGSRVVFTAGNRWGVDYVLGRMQRDLPTAHADTFFIRRRGMREPAPLANAIAILPGETDSLLVICAHIDASGSRDPGWERGWSTAKAPGADDNGTGIAAMLETLTLAAHGARKPHYTLMFAACNAEEKNPEYAGHHLGSRHIAERLVAGRAPVKGVIAMDMVGWNPRELYIPIFSTSRSTWLARELDAQGRWLGLRLALSTGNGPCPNSDNESFDRAGIPAVLLMESCKPWRSDPHYPRNPAYHTSRDLPSMVNYQILEYVTRLVASYAMRH